MKYRWLVCVLAACNHGSSSQPVDASTTPDGTHVDATLEPVVDAAVPGPVSLHIVRRTVGQAGIVVLFQNADSSLVSEAITDASGTASASMVSGGFVTAIAPFGAAPQGFNPATGVDLRTFTDVRVGDQLRLFQSDLGTPDISITVIVPAKPGVSYYSFWSSCNGCDSHPDHAATRTDFRSGRSVRDIA